ncbi:cytochrome P450 [Streptomyces sp. SID13031]|uniref:cytochrome P450 n=1 Tax=Streptomyces sp. SID13031 TaxID=2706046 RepID=UPI0019422EB3|nr:cytochrome P450 [Streptomyces sp. SID13031]
MPQLGQTLSFASGLYRQRINTLWAGYALDDPMALLQLRPGRDNPYRIYERLRRDGTVTRTRLGNWVTTSHPVCDQVLRDRRFGVRPAGNPIGETPSDDLDLSFLDLNPPDHTRLRRLAQPAFSPKQMAGYRPRIEATVSQLLDRAAAAGSFDLVSALAAPLPIAVITNLLGIPDPDAENFARYGGVIGGALDGVQSLSHAARLQKADAELSALFTDLFALRRREPADDIVSRLVAAEGDQVQPAEMVPMCVLLLVAGFETTVNLIGNAVNALLDHPDQWDALRADPATMAPKAVEETLRFDPPVQRTGRFALQSLELAGKPVREGEFVVTLIGAANRDPQVYADPDRFDITRKHTPPTTSPSPAASTTASASHSPNSKPPSLCRHSRNACQRCGAPARPADATRAPSAGPSTSRFASASPHTTRRPPSDDEPLADWRVCVRIGRFCSSWRPTSDSSNW